MPKLFDRFRSHTTTTESKAAPIVTSNKELNKLLVKFVGFTTSLGQARAEFVYPEYDLEEIKKAADADSYIKTSLNKYSYLIFKAGYQYRSDNDKAMDYIKMRLKLMSIATKVPTDVLLQEMADDIVKFSNCFLVKARGPLRYPGITAKGVFGTQPVLGYFRVDPTTIKIKRDKHGKVLSYIQTNDDGEEKSFSPDDVVHIYMDKQAGNAYGTPRVSSALEDVKLLRRIEGNVLALIYRFAIPIIHFKVGANTPNQTGSQKEIDDLQAEVEKMAIDGMIFTNERTEVKAIGVEGDALDTIGPLKYFENRVFTALDVSESQMGRGGSKQDADSMEAQKHDTVKYMQRTLSVFINEMIILELLLEGGFNPIKNNADIVEFVFNEISLETKVKVENHEILKWQSNVTTIDETRTHLGMKTAFDESRLYAHMIDESVANAQQDNAHDNELETLKMTQDHADKQQDKALAAQKEASKNATSTSSPGKENGNGKTKSATSKAKDVENRNRPENQHGKTSAKVKESYLDKGFSKSKKIKNHEKNYGEVYKTYENLRNDIIENNSDPEFIFPVAKDTIAKHIKEAIELASSEGLERFITDYQKEFGKDNADLHINLSLSAFVKDAEADVEKLLKDIKAQLGDRDASILFDSLEYRLKFILEFYPRKVLWYTYIKAAERNNVKTLYVKYSSDKDAEKYPSKIDTKYFAIEDIPAYHSFCNCQLSMRQVSK